MLSLTEVNQSGKAKLDLRRLVGSKLTLGDRVPLFLRASCILLVSETKHNKRGGGQAVFSKKSQKL